MSNSKRSVLSDIEEETKEHPKSEHCYIKFPREKPILVNIGNADKVMASPLFLKYYARNNRGRYSEIHTHPGTTPLASPTDLNEFLRSGKAKSMVIYQQDPTTGKLGGYFCLTKTKKTRPGPVLTDDWRDMLFSIPRTFNALWIDYITHKYQKKLGTSSSWEEVSGEMEKIAKKHNLKYKFVPNNNYKLDRKSMRFEEQSGLEGRIEKSIAIGGIILTLIFFSLNFTGFAVMDLTQEFKNILGFFLFIITLIAGWFWMKRKNGG